ncbi:MAG: hypothetical protein SA339_05745 [Methanomassiliicoccus sp.]|nr:hypothetical protein [Methanomassiliicoccus sp.]
MLCLLCTLTSFPLENPQQRPDDLDDGVMIYRRRSFFSAAELDPELAVPSGAGGVSVVGAVSLSEASAGSGELVSVDGAAVLSFRLGCPCVAPFDAGGSSVVPCAGVEEVSFALGSASGEVSGAGLGMSELTEVELERAGMLGTT